MTNEITYGSREYTIDQLRDRFSIVLVNNPSPADIKTACSNISVLLDEAAYEHAIAKNKKAAAEDLYETAKVMKEKALWNAKQANDASVSKLTKDAIITMGKAEAIETALSTVRRATDEFTLWDQIMKRLKAYIELTNIANIANSIEVKANTPTNIPSNNSNIRQEEWKDIDN